MGPVENKPPAKKTIRLTIMCDSCLSMSYICIREEKSPTAHAAAHSGKQRLWAESD